MPDKRKSLSRKSIIRLVVLGIILFLGAGLSAGIQTYRHNQRVFRNAAESYAYLLTYESVMSDIDGILRNKEDICRIEERISQYLSNDNADEAGYNQLLKELEEEFDKESMKAYYNWTSVDTSITGFGNICKDIRYAYVVIPTEEDLIYVWDSDLESGTINKPFSHSPYTGEEKEHFMAIMSGGVSSDFFVDKIDGETLGTALNPIPDSDNKVCAVAAVDISISAIRYEAMKLLLQIAIVFLLIMLVSITIYHYVVRKQIINPIVTLTKTADGLVNRLQNEDEEPLSIDVHTKDEIDVLARSFERMDEKLLRYLRENATITAEKQRMLTELSLAARIQRDMLPRTFPPFPDRKEIDLYASMNPATVVGGDFYDFFMEGENRLWLVMADVSGKGIPAALFMMVSKIMVQNFALTLDGPAKVLEKVNDQISTNTAEEMFVTVWLGVLDLESGILRAANAGHEYPVLKTPGEDFELVRDKHGLVVGGIAGYQYREYQIKLQPGSRLFLYTDGLPEAADEKNQMFGIERTVNALNEVKEGTAKEVLEHVTQSVAYFVGSAPQFDDTTMLCLDYYGSGGKTDGSR